MDYGVFACSSKESAVGRDFDAGYGAIVTCVKTDCGASLDIE